MGNSEELMGKEIGRTKLSCPLRLTMFMKNGSKNELQSELYKVCRFF